MNESKDVSAEINNLEIEEIARAMGIHAPTIIKRLKDKFRIIPRTDSPEKHVEINDSRVYYHKNLKLKWREEKDLPQGDKL